MDKRVLLPSQRPDREHDGRRRVDPELTPDLSRDAGARSAPGPPRSGIVTIRSGRQPEMLIVSRRTTPRPRRRGRRVASGRRNITDERGHPRVGCRIPPVDDRTRRSDHRREREGPSPMCPTTSGFIDRTRDGERGPDNALETFPSLNESGNVRIERDVGRGPHPGSPQPASTPSATSSPYQIGREDLRPTTPGGRNE